MIQLDDLQMLLKAARFRCGQNLGKSLYSMGPVDTNNLPIVVCQRGHYSEESTSKCGQFILSVPELTR